MKRYCAVLITLCLSTALAAAKELVDPTRLSDTDTAAIEHDSVGAMIACARTAHRPRPSTTPVTEQNPDPAIAADQGGKGAMNRLIFVGAEVSPRAVLAAGSGQG